MSLAGDRLADRDEGEELRVSGRLAVLHHPAAVVNGVKVKAWVEIADGRASSGNNKHPARVDGDVGHVARRLPV